MSVSGEKLSNNLARGGTSVVLPHGGPLYIARRPWPTHQFEKLCQRQHPLPAAMVSPTGTPGWRGRLRRGSAPGAAGLRLGGWSQWGDRGVPGPGASQQPVLSPGPTRLALFLLCCTGAWLSVHMAPTRNPHCQKIVRELKGSSEQLLKVQVSAFQVSLL